MNVKTEIREECQRNNASENLRYEDWQIPEQPKRYIMQIPSQLNIPVKPADPSIEQVRVSLSSGVEILFFVDLSILMSPFPCFRTP